MKTAFPRCHYMRAALFIFLLLTGSPAFSGSDEPQFTRLSDALSFLDQALDQKDWEKLDSALYPPFGSEQPNRNNWPQLETGQRQSCVEDDVFRDELSGGSLEVFHWLLRLRPASPYSYRFRKGGRLLETYGCLDVPISGNVHTLTSLKSPHPSLGSHAVSVFRIIRNRRQP